MRAEFYAKTLPHDLTISATAPINSNFVLLLKITKVVTCVNRTLS